MARAHCGGWDEAQLDDGRGLGRQNLAVAETLMSSLIPPFHAGDVGMQPSLSADAETNVILETLAVRNRYGQSGSRRIVPIALVPCL